MFLAMLIVIALLAMLDGCGGGGGQVSSSEYKTVKVSVIAPNQQESRTVSVVSGTSALEALKKAFSYERKAQTEDMAGKTTIEGITGYWRYEVNQTEPQMNAKDYQITTDCSVDFFLLVP